MTLVLSTALGHLSGLECWSVIGGRGTGSALSLGFGKRVPSRRFSANTTLTLEERQFEPEYSLFVEAAWRLQSSDRVLMTWTEVDSDSAWDDGPKSLLGLRVESTSVRPIGLDLEVRFERGLVFSIFCDQATEEENYSFFTPEQVLTVGGRSVLVKGVRR